MVDLFLGQFAIVVEVNQPAESHEEQTDPPNLNAVAPIAHSGILDGYDLSTRHSSLAVYLLPVHCLEVRCPRFSYNNCFS